MRDPAATKAEIEAAIEGACKEFGWLKGRGWFPKKLPFDNQLRYEALDLIKRLPDEVMPPHLRDYICGALSKTRGVRRTYAAGRDGLIAYAVWDATMCGFRPTRNEATRRKEALGEPASQSACSIVTKALARVGVHMSERSIEDIWALQYPFYGPIYVLSAERRWSPRPPSPRPTPPEGKPRVR